MTRTDTNIARPEGYSAAEKLLSWARLGWRHIGLLSFVILAIMVGSSIPVLMDEVLASILLESLSTDEELERFELITRIYLGFPGSALYIVSGFLIQTYTGRFYGLMAVMFLTTLMSALMFLTNAMPAGAVVIYTFCSYFGINAIFTMAGIYSYESVPLKFRLIAVVCLSLGETLGMLVASLADQTAIAGKPAEDLWAIRGRMLAIVPSVLFVIAAGVGLAYTRRDTVLSRVNARGQAGPVYDALEREGVETTSEPIPMTKDEFEINTQKDLEDLDELRTLWGIVKRASPGPMGCMIGVLLVQAIFNKIFFVHYYYRANDYLGAGYAANYVPMMLLKHGTAMGGVSLAVGLYVWLKDIRFVPAAALLCAALGGVVCASVTVLDANGDPIQIKDLMGSMPKITSGVAMMLFGRPLAMSLFKVMMMDMFTTENRIMGMFMFRAIEALFQGIVGACEVYLKKHHAFFIISGATITVVGAIVFAVMYTTQWFENSLVCRDPELDACWLISSDQASVPVISSRDKISTGTSSKF